MSRRSRVERRSQRRIEEVGPDCWVLTLDSSPVTVATSRRQLPGVASQLYVSGSLWIAALVLSYLAGLIGLFIFSSMRGSAGGIIGVTSSSAVMFFSVFQLANRLAAMAHGIPRGGSANIREHVGNVDRNERER